MQQKTKLTFASLVAVSVLTVGALGAACSSATTNVEPPTADGDHASLPPITYGPAPTVFQPGAEMAVVQGDPSKAGAPFIIRLRLPNGYKIAPHTHPTDEHVTVISGTFAVGMGDTFKESEMASLPPGAFVTAPAQHSHYAQAKGATVVQVNAIGPFAITYINPNDLPKQARN